jgi:uncharacterized membrane protein YphA (DoxX/SURF4 family)
LQIKQILKQIVVSPWLYFAIRLLLGLIFVYAGFIKLIDPKAFAKTISHYDIVPESFLPAVAIGLPAIEFLSGLGLVFNIRGSLTTVLSLLLLFSLILGFGIVSNLNIDCGCFTQEEIRDHNTLRQALYRDLTLITAVLYLYLYRWIGNKRRLEPFQFKKINYKEEI